MEPEHIYECIEDDYEALSTPSRSHLVPPPLPVRNNASPAYVSPVRMRRTAVRTNPPRRAPSSSSNSAHSNSASSNSAHSNSASSNSASSNSAASNSAPSNSAHSSATHASTSALPQYRSVRDVSAHLRLSMRDVTSSRFAEFASARQAADPSRFEPRHAHQRHAHPRHAHQRHSGYSLHVASLLRDDEDRDFDFIDRFADWTLGGHLADASRHLADANAANGRLRDNGYSVAANGQTSKGGRQSQRARNAHSYNSEIDQLSCEARPWKPLHGTLC